MSTPPARWAGQLAATPAATTTDWAYPGVADWVHDWLAPVITADLGPGMSWCAQWWRHPQAVHRLDACWRAWEHLRLTTVAEPVAMSGWWRDHGDPCLTALLSSSRSPFRQCRDEHTADLPELPDDPPPPGWTPQTPTDR